MRIIPIIIICVITGLIACEPQQVSHGDRVVAEVKGQQLTIDEIRNNTPEYIYEQDSIAAIREYRKNWVNRQILVQEARRIGLTRNASVREQIRQAEKDILITALTDMVMNEAEKEKISRREAQSFYENHKDQFILNERHVRYRHLAAETLNGAQNAKNALMRGVSWEDVARRYSVEPETAIYNATQFWPESMAAKDYGPMHQYLQVIGITEISPINRVNGRFHFVQLREVRNEGDHPDIEWVLTQIEEWLMIEKRRRKKSAYERNLFLKADSNNEIRLYDVLNLEIGKELEIDTLNLY